MGEFLINVIRLALLIFIIVMPIKCGVYVYNQWYLSRDK